MVGKAARAKANLNCGFGAFCKVLRPNSKTHPGFFSHFFQTLSYRRRISALAAGANINNLRNEHLDDLDIPLPPFSEQQRIAEILDQAEGLRVKRRTAVAKLDTLIQSLFFELFGQSTRNEERWPRKPLGEYLRFLTSGGRGWAEFYATQGSRFIRSLDVQMNHIGNEDVVYVEPPDNAEARRTRVELGDVLLTITGSKIGRVAPVGEELAGAYVSQHVSILRLNMDALHPLFVSFFLSLDGGGQRQIAKAQYGQTKPGLNFDQIRGFEVPIPPINVQREFVRRYEVVEKLRKEQSESEGKLDSLFASLQHRAFRGEL